MKSFRGSGIAGFAIGVIGASVWSLTKHWELVVITVYVVLRLETVIDVYAGRNA